MKILTYKVMGYTGVHNPETEEVEQIECLATMVVECPTQAILEEKEEIAKAEAYNGEYTIEDDGKNSHPVAPHNILEGECVTIEGTLYLATQNIPSGEPVIAGQNAVETTIEEQLLMMKGE